MVTSLAMVLAWLVLITSPQFLENIGPYVRSRRGKTVMYLGGILVGAAVGLGLAHLAIKNVEKQHAQVAPPTDRLSVASTQRPEVSQRSAGPQSPNITAGDGSTISVNYGATPEPAPPRPDIHVATELRGDKERRVFLLSVVNKGDGIATPNARLWWLKSDDGQDHTNYTPRDIPWIDIAPRLSHSDVGKVIAVYVDHENKVLKFLGNDHRHVLMFSPTGQRIGASFRIKISLPGTRWFADRDFRLEPDETAPLKFRAVLMAQEDATSF